MRENILFPLAVAFFCLYLPIDWRFDGLKFIDRSIADHSQLEQRHTHTHLLLEISRRLFAHWLQAVQTIQIQSYSFLLVIVSSQHNYHKSSRQLLQLAVGIVSIDGTFKRLLERPTYKLLLP